MDELPEVKTGQTWGHKAKGYDVKVVYINKSKQLAVEEIATAQRDGFSREYFLANFVLT